MDKRIYDAPFMELEEIETEDVLLESYYDESQEGSTQSHEGIDLDVDDIENSLGKKSLFK